MMRKTKSTPRRRSQQRERILELLKSTDSHPTANWIYARLRRDFPSLSMGTVYRNLAVLAEQGLISRIGFGSTFDRFDAKTGHHYHLICDHCGTIIDLDLPVDESLNRRVRAAAGLEARSHDIQFRGTCASCARKIVSNRS
ncbi:MAG TPA: transcriptional repressor [Spirochaetia bacterium]|nr:transcriptional repressor [Spirochaetia bacterium]